MAKVVGQRVGTPEKKEPEYGTFETIGLSGLNHQAGYVYEEFLPQLQGLKAIRVYKEMASNDPIIASMLFAIDMFLRKVNWSVQKASEDQKGEEDAKFLEECMGDMSGTWPDFISEVTSMLEQGWSYFEILYKRRTNEEKADGNLVSKFNDNKIGWRKFDPRSQDSLDRWEFDEEGGIRGMWQRPAPTYQLRYIPIGKALLFRTTSRKNNPEGKSVLRSAYRPWYFKKRIEEIEGVGVERDLAGLPMAEVPVKMLQSDASDADKAMIRSIKELVKNVRRDRQEGIIWPQQYDAQNNPLYNFKLLSSGGTRQFNTSEIITRYEQRMAMTVLADFILTGHDSTGSFALATSKSGMFQAALGAWLDIINDVVNNYAVPRLFRLNGVDGPYPTIIHDPVQQVSLNELATMIAALAGAGAQLFPDTDLENHFRELMHLPLREDKDKDSSSEQELRNATLAAQIAAQRSAEKQAELGPQQQLEQIKGMQQQQKLAASQPKPLGKDPASTPGAPTPKGGPHKMAAPPRQRRDTAGSRAAANVAKVAKLTTPEFMHAREKLGDHYPEEVLEWTHEAKWFGPMDVNLSDIAMARRPGGRDPDKVKGIAEAIDSGKKMDPVFLVLTPDFRPGEGKLRIADGYHRTLGFQKSNLDSIPAYVAVVDDTKGPWDKAMHDAKLNKHEGEEP
ncbi:hypothetical protein [Streptomyces sp. NPDC006477]|uniref:phage portal protein family protein n=1 Tax=Streptomyces sp. NPDC006477 TaxID=3364747 RepID=UPI0036C028AA